MDIVEKIKEICKDKKIPIYKLERDCGFSNGYISHLKEGTVRADRLYKISEYLGVSPEYFTAKDDSNIFSDPNIFPIPRMVKKPRLGNINCGVPLLTEENLDGYDDVPEYINCDFTLKAEGDSMIDARISAGDIVYVRQSDYVENGQIAVVMIEDQKTLKRFYRDGDRVTLMPANQAYAPLIYVGEELKKIRILGRAVGFTSVL